MSDDELYEKYYKEALRDLGRQYGFNTANPKVDVKKKAEDKVAKDAKDNMVDFAKGKDINDKIQAVDEAIQDIGMIVGATKGAVDARKDAKRKQDASKFIEMQKAMDSNGKGELRIAAGGEDMSPKAVLDTKNLTLEQKNNLMRGFAEAETKLGSKGFELDPSTDVSKFKDRKDVAKKKKRSPMLGLSPEQRREAAKKGGYETLGDQKKDAHKNYERYRNKQTQYIPGEEPKDTRVLDKSIKLGDDVYEKSNELTGPRKINDNTQRIFRRIEKNGVSKITNFMEAMERYNPKEADKLRRLIVKNNGDLHIRDTGNKVLSKAMEDSIKDQLTMESTGNSPQGRLPRQIISRREPIENMLLNDLSEQELYNTSSAILGRNITDQVVNKFGPAIAKKKMATGIATMVAGMLYSEENDDKTINKIVKGNAEQLSGKNAKAWAGEGEKIWSQWLKDFDAESMDSEKDYRTFLEAEQLMDDYKKGNKIMSNSGNTNPMSELMTDPKFIKMLMKYNPDDASRLFE